MNNNKINENIEYDLSVTLFTHDKMAAEDVSVALSRFDARINKRLIGRNYHLPKNASKRANFVGFIETTPSNDTPHIHLLMKFAMEQQIERFLEWIERDWHQCHHKGRVGSIQRNAKDITDPLRRVRAQVRNKGIDHDGFTKKDVVAMLSYYLKNADTQIYITEGLS